MGDSKCQLSVKILGICQLSVKWLSIINYKAFLFIFDPDTRVPGQEYLHFYQLCYWNHFKCPPFLESCFTLLHANVFARVQHFQPLSQSKFIPSEHWEVDLMKNQDRLFRIISLKTSLRSKRFRLVSEQKRPKNGILGFGRTRRGRFPSFLPHLLPALLLAPFFARCLTLGRTFPRVTGAGWWVTGE